MRQILTAFFVLAVLFCFACQSKEIPNSASPSTTTTTPVSDSEQNSDRATTSSEPQRITFESPDKTIIVGSYFESPQPNSPAVLLLHQWQSNRHSYDVFAKRMQAKGFNVLSIDGRGFGESVKTADGNTVQPERTDAAVKAMLGDVARRSIFCRSKRMLTRMRSGSWVRRTAAAWR